jgi:hypothetical protein
MVTLLWSPTLSLSGLFSSVSIRFLLLVSCFYQFSTFWSRSDRFHRNVRHAVTNQKTIVIHSELQQNFRWFNGTHNEVPRLGASNYLSWNSIKSYLRNRASPSLRGDQYKLTGTHECEPAVQRALLMRSEGFMTLCSLVGGGSNVDSSIGIVAGDRRGTVMQFPEGVRYFSFS